MTFRQKWWMLPTGVAAAILFISCFAGYFYAGPTLASASQAREKLTVTPTPLDADQIEIYRTFLDSYVEKNRTPMNVANTTSPLDIPDRDAGDCVKGIQLEQSSAGHKVVHKFTSEFAQGKSIRLVDPKREKVIQDPEEGMREGKSVKQAVAEGFASGLFRFSEIAFDKGRQYAVFRYSFVCGALCGQGGTVVFEKHRTRWERSKRSCSAWIS